MNGEEPQPAKAGATAPATMIAPGEHAVSATARFSSDGVFVAGMSALLGTYVLLIVGLLCALASFTDFAHIRAAIATEEIRFALRLSLISCTLSTLLSLCVAIPGGYVLSRCKFRGRDLVDALIDIPVVLPPLVIGLSLLILFQTDGARAPGVAPVVRRWSRAAVCARVDELAGLLGIGHLLDRKPGGLSGGEAQRVALGPRNRHAPGCVVLRRTVQRLGRRHAAGNVRTPPPGPIADGSDSAARYAQPRRSRMPGGPGLRASRRGRGTALLTAARESGQNARGKREKSDDRTRKGCERRVINGLGVETHYTGMYWLRDLCRCLPPRRHQHDSGTGISPTRTVSLCSLHDLR